MSEPTSDACIVAAAVFVETARREWIKRNPNDDCPFGNLRDMDAASSRTLQNVMRAVLRATHPSNIERFIERLREQNDG